MIIVRFPGSEKLHVDNILSELKYNAACQIKSWDVFAMASCAAPTRTRLKAFSGLVFFIQTAAYAQVCILGNV